MSSLLWHDLVVMFRRSARRKLHTAVGVTVLTLGLTCFIAAYTFVGYLRSYDQGFANADRSYFIAQSIRFPQFGIEQPFSVFSTLPLAERLRLDVPELDGVARVFRADRGVVIDGEPAQIRVAYAEPDFLAILDWSSAEGLRDVLRRPASAVLTRAAAERLFGRSDAVGRTITLNGSHAADVTVAAVIADPPSHSHLSADGLASLGFDVVVSWDVFEAIEQAPYMVNWGTDAVMTYVRLPAHGGLTIAELDRRLAVLAATNIPEQLRPVLTIGFSAKPVSAIAPRLFQQQFEGSNNVWHIDVLTAVLCLGAALLAMACLNFVNLATAETNARELEIGTRKALGASRSQIVRQELTATAFRATAAIALASAVVVPVGAVMTGPWRLALGVPWADPRFWSFLAVLLAVVTLAAGAYPALVLSRLRPIETLRLSRGGAGRPLLRAVLVGTQFAAASFLVVAVTVGLAERDALREELLERFEDPYVGFFVGPVTGPIDPDVLATELTRSPAIRGAASMWQPPFEAALQQGELRRSQDSGAPSVSVDSMLVGYDYFEVMRVPLLAGRVFARDRADDQGPTTPAELAARAGRPSAAVLDRVAARALGWRDPADAIGQVVYAPGQDAREVVGVVETVPLAIRASRGTGTAYNFGPQMSNYWVVRIDKRSVADGTAQINAVLRRLAPSRPPPELLFLDDVFAVAYGTFAVTQRVLMTLGAFALAIAAVGVFGMASFITSRRTREVGIRKTQGAKPSDILRQFLWDYSKPALAANLAAFPLALFAVDRYLDLFANRITLTPLPFAIALLATLFVAGVAVIGFVLRVARLRPAEALRQE
jgi:putative ABC transport system permease protein